MLRGARIAVPCVKEHDPLCSSRRSAKNDGSSSLASPATASNGDEFGPIRFVRLALGHSHLFREGLGLEFLGGSQRASLALDLGDDLSERHDEHDALPRLAERRDRGVALDLVDVVTIGDEARACESLGCR